ncbi:hypothetical protein I312_101461 [Cryptococcus bacillisporus CA1280]|uniref:NmrA-like domain-containing protein n=1 Tax=Cryptococcus bacillisporus CA1280 TaxID=1296109 RepID=A0A0D0TJI2_CRYGA|nr:hypothetical protein I312_04074 [Cryptococcus bacillisporus CA1280]
MSPIVALIGHNGTVGENILPYLVDAHKKGSIKLVILHRPNSDLSKIPSDAGIEKRIIELEEGKVDAIKAVVKDLEVVISTIAAANTPNQVYLAEALVGSPVFKTFIPSDFGCVWSEEEISSPGLSILKIKEEAAENIKHLKVPITEIKVGMFDLFFFGYKAGGTDVKGNQVQHYHKSLNTQIPITSLSYLGYSVAQLVSDPSLLAKLPNSTPYIFDYAPTGQEIVDVLTQLHGQPTKTVEVNEENMAERLKGSWAVGAAVIKKWGDNNWGKVPKTEISGWTGKSFAETVKEWVNKA